MDQAHGLRELSHANASTLRVLPLVTGMRSVGHTSTAVNLAAALGSAGQRVLVLDAGRALIAAALDLRARYELMHLLTGEKSIQETLLRADLFDVLPAIKGVEDFLASGVAVDDLFGGFTALAKPYRTAILAAAGPQAAALTPVDTEIVFVTNDSPESVKSTYAELKRLATEHGRQRFRIIFNDIADEHAAHDSYARLADTAQRFFRAELSLGGIVPHDLAINRASVARAHVFAGDTSPARQAYARMAADVETWKLAEFSPATP
jgi:flagellar biosynthesis protein FlhG